VTSFLVDQQLPKALATYLAGRGYDARHTKDYPGGATMPDRDVGLLADSEDRFVVTKDEDFRISHLLGKPPARPVRAMLSTLACRSPAVR
jgi:predicted nuclease of predicted toxin-antitoxin system